MEVIILPPSLSENGKAAGNPFKPAAVALNGHIRNTSFLHFSPPPPFLRTGNSKEDY